MTGTPNGQSFSGFTSGQVIGGVPLIAPSSWISLTPVKPTPWIVAVVPCSTGVSSFTLMRTRTNWGSGFHSAISFTWPDGTPEKATVEPLFSPSTDCLKKMSYSFSELPLSRAIHTVKIASTSSRISTTAPTRTWFDRVSISPQPLCVRSSFFSRLCGRRCAA